MSSARPHNRGLRRSASPSAEVTRSLPIGRRPGRLTRCPFGPGSPSAGSSGSNPPARSSGSWLMKPRPSFGLGGGEPHSDEDGPDRGPSGLPVLPTPPREEGHRILDVHPQMTTVPLDQCLRILRFEENASEARHAGSTLSCRHIPGVVLDGYEGEVERSSSS